MAVDQSFVGRTYPPEDVYEVSAEKVREFASAVAGAGSATVLGGPLATADVPAVHTDAAAARALGHADVVAPPTFAVVLAQRSDARFLADPAAGVDFSRVVHGEQSFTHHRPVVVGDRLVTTLHVDGVRVAAGNAIVTTRNEIATEGGEPVCTATSVLVVRAPETPAPRTQEDGA
ncbi:MaoC family dehydratase N-terminal domain-containing protein [uncultured Pseudokineococcus sp.]|uniref:FAS1-like dehydratase domain-containing protein n=1 Tax=uncultured Pseudokineococcus sp. TaxID=1642928 RepID=UPI0026150917|nr:MaoC family dehydratase N-terminal domain-containing protein [uncultured Pseudokineococcus sp.]